MPDLILMPKAHMIQSHYHQQDTSGLHYNCMTPQMPTPINEQIDFMSDLGEIASIWGDQVYGMVQHLPKFAFWSLDDLRAWVREHADNDVYAVKASGMLGLHLCSTDQPTMERLQARFLERKNHLVRVRMDSLMTDEVREWIAESCAGKNETILGMVNGGGRENEYMFRDETDATLFTVRWKGHGALTIL